jgi:hypothetical protein
VPLGTQCERKDNKNAPHCVPAARQTCGCNFLSTNILSLTGHFADNHKKQIKIKQKYNAKFSFTSLLERMSKKERDWKE